MIPEHGKINCSECFSDKKLWGENTLITNDGNWCLENNPCAWGSQNPRVLVLGFSKGNKQSINSHNIDNVPYSGFRDRLTEALRVTGLLSNTESVSDKISADERDFAFGSLIRCSISKKDNKTGKFEKSSCNILPSALRNNFSNKIVHNCIKHFLTDLPERLRLIVLLGNSSSYINNLYEIFKEYYPDLIRLNAVSYSNKKLTFVHIAHPSGANGHFNNWLNSEIGKQAEKRKLAIQAIKQA